MGSLSDIGPSVYILIFSGPFNGPNFMFLGPIILIIGQLASSYDGTFKVNGPNFLLRAQILL